MNATWWIIWLFGMSLLFLPMGYGWGYRGWGPPYPSYLQRRREQQAVAAGRDPGFDHYAWGYGGDLVWLMLMVVVFWSLVGVWPHR